MRLILVSLLWITFVRATTPDAGVRILTEESANTRSVMLLSPLDAGKTAPEPRLQLEAASGKFQITFPGLDTTRFLGPRFLRAEGQLPLHLNVFFPDDSSIVLRGRTVPFDDIALYYRFDNQRYVLEIFRFGSERASGTTILERSWRSARQPVADLQNLPEKTSASRRESSVPASREALLRMLKLGAGISGALTLVLLGLVWTRYRKTSHPGKPSGPTELAGSEPVSVEPSPPGEESTREDREERIRTVMQQLSITYDEAALRVSLEGEHEQAQ